MTDNLASSMRKFNGTFWAAIAVELLHCLASYTMLDYLIVYLAQDLGFGDIRANALYGMLLFAGYFLPILIGALADRYGFRETMVVSLAVMVAGYFLASRVTSYPGMAAALMVVALGGAVIKPVIAGTVKSCSDESNRSLGFSIYYTVINIGSSIAPFLANGVRVSTGHPGLILVASGIVEAFALAVTFFFFRNIEIDESARAKPLIKVLAEMTVVLGNARLMITAAGCAAIYFIGGHYNMAGGALVTAVAVWIAANLLWDLAGKSIAGERWGSHALLDRQRFGDGRLLGFIIIFSGVWALYSQIWTNIPLYITSLDPAMKAHIEWFQAVDPIMIVLFQVLIGKWMGRFRPLPSMVAGIVISSFAVGTVNLFGSHLGAWAVGISLGIWSIGEMMFSPRSVEYVTVIAPKEKLALYIGYGFLPLAIGFGVGPSLGAFLIRLFARIGHAEWVWYGFGLWALFIAAALWAYDKLLNKKAQGAARP